LETLGHWCVDDPARLILKEQRSIAGSGVPEADAGLFNRLMLYRAIYLYRSNVEANDHIVFDKGIPDLLAYADLFGIVAAVHERAPSTYTCNKKVFYFAGGREIYTVDDERKMDFESANIFGENVARIYERLGYKTVEVPRVPVGERVEFIVDVIQGGHEDRECAIGDRSGLAARFRG